MSFLIKTAFIDVDDILLSFFCAFHSYLQQKGFNVTKSYIPKNWNYSELFPNKEDFFEHLNPFVESLTSDLLPFEGADQFTLNLKKKGWNIVLITAHPIHLMMERITNLKKYNIYFDHFYSTSFYKPDGTKVNIEKSELIKLLGYDDKTKFKNLFIDDRFKSVESFVKNDLGIGASIKRSYNYDDINNCDEEILNKILLSRGGKSKTQQVQNLYKMILDFA